MEPVGNEPASEPTRATESSSSSSVRVTEQWGAASDPLEMSDRAYRWTLAAILAVAATLYLHLALTEFALYWPDEAYQVLEPAHRAAFGFGMYPWEFRDGARSWILPGTVAATWKVASALGADSGRVLVGLARTLAVAGSVLGVWLVARLGTVMRGRLAGCIAAALWAFFPMALLTAFRTLSETMSLPVCLLAAYLVTRERRLLLGVAGFAAALTTFLRYPNGLFALVLCAYVVSTKRRALGAFLSGAAVGTALGAGVDWLTWGAPLHSLREYAAFNLGGHSAAAFGASPWYFFAQKLGSATGPVIVAWIVAALVGARRAPWIAALAVVPFVSHSAVGHKELRFIVPTLPFFALLVAFGVAALAARLRRRAKTAVVTAATVLVMGGVVRSVGLTYEHIGLFDDGVVGRLRVWHTLSHDANLLLFDVGERPDLCGLAIVGPTAVALGGYAFVHRPVPLAWSIASPEEQSAANYMLGFNARIAKKNPQWRAPAGYALVARRGRIALYRRPGTCTGGVVPEHLPGH